jgi:hypothetical protein
MKRNMSDPTLVFALCGQAGSSSEIRACMSGAVSMYMNQEGTFVAGQKLCERAPEFYQDMCYRATKESVIIFLDNDN